MENLADTVRMIATLWKEFDSRERGNLTRKNRPLTDALYQLCQLVELGTDGDAPTDDSGSVDWSDVQTIPSEYPAEKRVKDLERMFDGQRTRAEALHHARKSWGGTMSEEVDRHARNVTTLAQAFERFLTDGTVHEVPTNPNADAGAHREYEPLQIDIINAALAWVDQSHTHNLGGPENWRQWADDHDKKLINAVLAYRGLPPLLSVKP